jgi:asparagine synthase (glutamine-hydrolysing)
VTALAGYWSFGSSADPMAPCERMLRSQQAYAPDSPVSRSLGSLAMGRRLFRLLPEDRFDRGPQEDPERETLLVADLRLDNRDELCADLGVGPADAARLSDATILMRALDRWDEGAPDRLVGDFAFAHFDMRRQRLLLARDFVGQRPLHFHRGDGFFAFASMPKGLHALEEVPRAPDRQAMADFIALIPETGTETHFEGIEKVPAGHVMVVTPGSAALRRYWKPERRELRLSLSSDYEEALREHLVRAVACRLRGAEAGVAAHLSGGLDSGAVAATAAGLLAPEGRRVTAYTAVPREGFTGDGPGGSITDEGALAAEVARLHPNIDHILVRAGDRSPLARMRAHHFLYDRPFGNPCNGTWWDAILDDAKQRRLRVLLTGTMGNLSLSFDGMTLLPQLLRRARLLSLAATAGRLVRNGSRVGSVAAAAVGPFVPAPLWKALRRLRGRIGALEDYSAANPANLAALRERAAARSLDPGYRPRRDGVEMRLWAASRVDGGNYGKGMLAGWGIDVRDPAADRRLFEFCLSVPEEEYLAGGVPRSLARRAFADRLPESVRSERRKGYQAADWHEGLSRSRAELEEEIARLSASPLACEALDLPRMRRLLEQWPEGDWNDPRIVQKYRIALLKGVSAGHFIRTAAGSND